MKFFALGRGSRETDADRSLDLEFMADLSSAVREQTPRASRFLLWGVFSFFVLALIWASRAELDEVTRGSGKVIPSRQVQVVQNLEGGILSEILVAEGDIVEPGQTLLRIDDTRFASSFREAKVKVLTLQAKIARLRAEAEGILFEGSEKVEAEQPELLQREMNLYNLRREELDTNLGILNQQVSQRSHELAELEAKRDQLAGSYKLAKRELDLTAPLVNQGAVSEVELLRLKRQVNDLKGELESTRLAIPRVQSTYDEAIRKVEELELQFRTKARSELNDTISELARLTESNQALEDRFKRTWVKSPVHGTIKQLLVNTIGGVIQPGMDLVAIVPLEDTLLVETKIRPKDIAFLRPGQNVTVKFTAYDFAIYGGLDAQLEQISADAIADDSGESFYLVKVRTNRNFLGSENKPLPIIPGMQTEVDILTGKKTVLAYLLKPVLRATYVALTER